MSAQSKNVSRIELNVSVDLFPGTKPKLQKLAHKSKMSLTEYVRRVLEDNVQEGTYYEVIKKT